MTVIDDTKVGWLDAVELWPDAVELWPDAVELWLDAVELWLDAVELEPLPPVRAARGMPMAASASPMFSSALRASEESAASK